MLPLIIIAVLFLLYWIFVHKNEEHLSSTASSQLDSVVISQASHDPLVYRTAEYTRPILYPDGLPAFNNEDYLYREVHPAVVTTYGRY